MTAHHETIYMISAEVGVKVPSSSFERHRFLIKNRDHAGYYEFGLSIHNTSSS